MLGSQALTEGRDFLMHARIGMLRALNRHIVRAFNLSRKDAHWGRRKLVRIDRASGYVGSFRQSFRANCLASISVSNVFVFRP
jgi:hypothetical protein